MYLRVLILVDHNLNKWMLLTDNFNIPFFLLCIIKNLNNVPYTSYKVEDVFEVFHIFPSKKVGSFVQVHIANFKCFTSFIANYFQRLLKSGSIRPYKCL